MSDEVFAYLFEDPAPVKVPKGWTMKDEVWLAFGPDRYEWGGSQVLGVFATKEDAMKACTPEVVLFFEDRTAPKSIERWAHGDTHIEKHVIQ